MKRIFNCFILFKNFTKQKTKSKQKTKKPQPKPRYRVLSVWRLSVSTWGWKDPAQWSRHTCIAWDWTWKLHIKMTAALGLDTWEQVPRRGWRQQCGIVGTACSIPSDGHSCAEQQYKQDWGNQKPPRVHMRLCFRSLDSFRCSQMHRVRWGRPVPTYKIPFAQGGRTWHKFYCRDTVHLSHLSWLMIKWLLKSSNSLQIQ